MGNYHTYIKDKAVYKGFFLCFYKVVTNRKVYKAVFIVRLMAEHQSRITAGSIDDVIKRAKVDRIGFVRLAFDRQFLEAVAGQHKLSILREDEGGQIVMLGFAKAYGTEISFLNEILMYDHAYLSHAHFLSNTRSLTGIHGLPETVYFATGDLYKEKQ